MTVDRIWIMAGGVVAMVAVLALLVMLVDGRLSGGNADDRDEGWAADDEEIVSGW